VTAHEHSLTLYLTDTLYAALRRLADGHKRSMESVAVALLQSATVAPRRCDKPTSECQVHVTALSGDTPTAGFCGTCGRQFDLRANPIGNGARY